MAQSDSRRLHMVMEYLYPDLKTDTDYYLLDKKEVGTGTQLFWLNDAVPEPTEQEISDAKFNAMDTYWWKRLRQVRDKLLVKSDWSQGTDVPSALKSSYATYRTNLRDLPTTVTKPSAETLNNEKNDERFDNGWNMNNLMPTKS